MRVIRTAPIGLREANDGDGALPLLRRGRSGGHCGSVTMEEFPPWDFRGLSDLIFPVVSEDDDMLLWGAAAPPAEEYATSLGSPPVPPAEELSHWALSPGGLLDQPPPPPQGYRMSAFVEYERAGYYGDCRRSGTAGGGGNIHRRVMEYLRKIPAVKAEKNAAESSRCFRHMMRERQRRERLSQSYADLHSMIVPKPKANKNAIVLSAAAYVRELKATKEALQRRYQELRASLGEGGGGRRPEGATIKLRVGNPSSPVESMIAALRRLKGMDVRARSIRSCAADRELSAVIDVETKMAREEVEKAVQETLVETEWKLRTGSGRAGVDPTTARSKEWWSPKSHLA